MIALMPRVLPLLLLLCALAAACAAPKATHGTVFAPPQPPRRFSLVDQTGAPRVLAAKRDRFTALYFGFTHCKDVCPQTLAMLGKAREEAGLRPDQLQIVMVSVDPSRDTPAALRGFFSKVGVRAVGLTGRPAQMQRVYRAYGVAVEPKHGDIGHTDYVYLLDRSGALVELLSPHTSSAAVAEDLRALVER
jgi:protein SCO1/2